MPLPKTIHWIGFVRHQAAVRDVETDWVVVVALAGVGSEVKAQLVPVSYQKNRLDPGSPGCVKEPRPFVEGDFGRSVSGRGIPFPR
jgi:hypothetical protein